MRGAAIVCVTYLIYAWMVPPAEFPSWLREARALRGIAASERYPTVDATLGYERRLESENTAFGEFIEDSDLFSAGFDENCKQPSTLIESTSHETHSLSASRANAHAGVVLRLPSTQPRPKSPAQPGGDDTLV